MIRVYRYALSLFDIICRFEDGKPMAYAYDAHLFQLFVPQGYQSFADYFVLCALSVNASPHVPSSIVWQRHT